MPEEFGQCRFLVIGFFLVAGHQDDEVICVADQEERRMSVLPVPQPSPLRERAAFPGSGDPSTVAFVKGGEVNIGQQGRDDSALRRPGHRVPDVPFCQNARLEERQDQMENFLVPHPTTNPLHQEVMVDVVEAARDVTLDDVLHLGRTRFVRVQMPLNHRQRVQSASSPAEPIRGRIEVRLV